MVRVFVVTGSNKGIGKSIVKLLLKDKEEKLVYLTSRNPVAGEKAVKELKETVGIEPQYHQLDITNKESIIKLRDHLLEKHGGFDVLVNNAAIAANDDDPFSYQAKSTIDCNFFGTLDVCDILFPILKDNARISNVSGSLGSFAFMRLSNDWKQKFADPNLTIPDLKTYISAFVDAAANNEVQERGFPKSALGMSKLGVSCMSVIHQREFDAKVPEKNILVNFACPGSVATDMSQNRGAPVDEGADTPTLLALIPPHEKSPKGQFFQFRKRLPFPP